MLVSTPTVPDGELAQTNTVKRRRRPATGAEHARRVAWGKKYGRLNREGWAQTKARAGIE